MTQEECVNLKFPFTSLIETDKLRPLLSEGVYKILDSYLTSQKNSKKRNQISMYISKQKLIVEALLFLKILTIHNLLQKKMMNTCFIVKLHSKSYKWEVNPYVLAS